MHSERRRTSGTANPSAGTIHTSAPKPRKYAIGIPSVSGMIGHAGVDERAAARGAWSAGTYRLGAGVDVERFRDERFGEGGHAAPFTSPSMSSPIRATPAASPSARSMRYARGSRATASSAATSVGLVVGERDEVARRP